MHGRRCWAGAFFCGLLLGAVGAHGAIADDALETVAERSGYERASDLADVEGFLDAVSESALVTRG